MKTIAILGGSKNLGKYLSIEFSKKFHNVLVLSRSGNFIGSQKLMPKNINHYSIDLKNKKKVIEILRKIKKRFKSIDLIISCVGDGKSKKTRINDSSHWQSSFATNFITFSNFLESYEYIFKFKETKIVVISSIAGIKPINAPMPYSVSKKALIYYCQLKALELSKFNIKLNIISPGNILQKNNVWSKKILKNSSKTRKYIKKMVPLNCFCTPSQILEMCNYLYSESGDRITGSNFIIDAGQSL